MKVQLQHFLVFLSFDYVIISCRLFGSAVIYCTHMPTRVSFSCTLLHVSVNADVWPLGQSRVLQPHFCHNGHVEAKLQRAQLRGCQRDDICAQKSPFTPLLQEAKMLYYASTCAARRPILKPNQWIQGQKKTPCCLWSTAKCCFGSFFYSSLKSNH